LFTTPALLPIAEKIKGDWAAIGVNTNIQVSNTPPQNFQTLLAIQAIPSDPDQYSFWHSTQSASNITNYHNSKESQRIDKLLEDGRRTLDQDERKKIYLDFQRFLVEDCPVIFLYHPVTYTIEKQ
jgi:peptide/nickel transport system substrate-binding protein